jgi:hypothetical protein
MVARMVADPNSSGGWAVSRFKFEGDEELSGLRQAILSGWSWPRVAFLVAYLMGLPLRIYVSYICWGTGWGAAGAMLAWTIFEGWAASTRRA